MKSKTAHAGRVAMDPSGLNTAATPLDLLEHFTTPVDRFFTRTHGNIPAIDPAKWELIVDGQVERPVRFTLDALRAQFLLRETTATLVCAGLRRAEFLALGPLPGELPWRGEAISNGRWSGVRLADVLRAAGVKREAKHVEFIGLDEVERHGNRFGFGGSIDLAKALQDDVLLATALDGKTLDREHGFPVRVVVPGWIGARCVKWLGRINVRSEPSTNYFEKDAYRIQHKADPGRPRDVSAGSYIGEAPVNSVILSPALDEAIGREFAIRGWAMGSGGRPVASVEVSTNGGEDWQEARITSPNAAGTWAFWTVDATLAPGDHELVVRATDAGGATQPAALKDVWNVKGYCNNAWHRVRVRVR